LRELVKNGEDHVLLIDVGPADKIELVMESIGKRSRKWNAEPLSYSKCSKIACGSEKEGGPG
jgi:hypothetical protein